MPLIHSFVGWRHEKIRSFEEETECEWCGRQLRKGQYTLRTDDRSTYTCSATCAQQLLREREEAKKEKPL